MNRFAGFLPFFARYGTAIPLDVRVVLFPKPTSYTMKQTTNLYRLLLVGLLLIPGFFAMAQQTGNTKKETPVMKTYLIERDIPGASKFTNIELKGISQKSCTVLTEMGPKIKWQQSYVAGNKIYCVYQAENEELLREHAKKGGFPITQITEIANIISPETAKDK